MIHPSFYRQENLRREYFGGRVPHHTIKRRSKAIGSYTYTLKAEETVFDLAPKVFGEDAQRNWTFLAELNTTRKPDEWDVNEVVTLPKIVVVNRESTLTKFSDAEITSTPI